MKLKFLFLLVFGLMMVSCGDDDPETELPENCDVLEEAIIGVWESDENPGSTIEFKSNGTVVDDSFLFVDNDFSAGATVAKKYRTTGEDKIEFTYSVGLTIRIKNGTVQEFDCSNFRIAVNSALLNFTRK